MHLSGTADDVAANILFLSAEADCVFLLLLFGVADSATDGTFLTRNKSLNVGDFLSMAAGVTVEGCAVYLETIKPNESRQNSKQKGVFLPWEGLMQYQINASTTDM